MFTITGQEKINRIQCRLFILAGVFLFFIAVARSIAPSVLSRSAELNLRRSHWIGFFIWLIMIIVLHQGTKKWVPYRDPYLLPISTLLVGWGLQTIWGLSPDFGSRQAIWISVSLVILMVGMRSRIALRFLRDYKDIWLILGLLLTALTLILGTNPTGYGPRLWLGCCGLYLQPSEPLKLLFIVYLAAYLATWQNIRNGLIKLLTPTTIVASLAVLTLIVQQDLGTALILLFLYTTVIFGATNRKRLLIASQLIVLIAAIGGYYLFDVVRLRMDAWINPWLDPSGRSYQIVQSLLAIASGGVLGRGPGLGSPQVVPISHSDFIFSAIAEETGFLGGMAILILLAFLTYRGINIAFNARDSFNRYLAFGLTTYIAGQSILIIGGNIRFLPLTGVTLPFVSYGGSSLTTSILALLFLIHVSAQSHDQRNYVPAEKSSQQAMSLVSSFIFIGFVGCASFLGWWSIYRWPALIDRLDNPRRSISDRYVQRGSIVDRNDVPINFSEGSIGHISRSTSYPALSLTAGYSHPAFGQSGLEASLDDPLRGLSGYPQSTILWERFLYGQPPSGLDVRLTIDLELQESVDEILAQTRSALVLINAQNGEILVIASHPHLDPNTLSEDWDELIIDELAPLLNRATLGQYSIGDLGARMHLTERATTFELVGALPIRMQTEPVSTRDDTTILANPYHMALVAVALSVDGSVPPPVLVTHVLTPESTWQSIPPLGQTVWLFDTDEVKAIIQDALSEENYWYFTSSTESLDGDPIAWFIAGVLDPIIDTSSIGVALIVESDDLDSVEAMGLSILGLMVDYHP